MSREVKINLSDLKDGRQICDKMGISGRDLFLKMRKMYKDASHEELHQKSEEIFLDRNRPT